MNFIENAFSIQQNQPCMNLSSSAPIYLALCSVFAQRVQNSAFRAAQNSLPNKSGLEINSIQVNFAI